MRYLLTLLLRKLWERRDQVDLDSTGPNSSFDAQACIRGPRVCPDAPGVRA